MSRSPWRCYFFAHSFVNYYYDSIETATTSKNKEKKNGEEDNLEDSKNFIRKTDGKEVGGRNNFEDPKKLHFLEEDRGTLIFLRPSVYLKDTF